MKFVQVLSLFLLIGAIVCANPFDADTDITKYLQEIIGVAENERYVNGYIQLDEMFPDGKTGLYYELVTKEGCGDIDVLFNCGPLIIFIQGGPGYASSYSNWQSVGPINIQKGKLTYSQYSWNKFASLLFIDQPIGSGFSHVTNSKVRVTNLNDAATAMTFFMRKFYKRYPTAVEMPVVFFGEGYASHYISKIMDQFLDDNMLQDIEYLGIGNFGAWYHPVDNGNYYGNYLYSAGLVSDATRQKMNKKQTEMVQQLYQGNNTALGTLLKYLNDISRNLIKVGDYNYEKADDKNDTSFIDFLKANKNKLGIPAECDYVTFNSQLVTDLMDDIGHSFLENLNELMADDQEINFLFINGQLDVAFNNPGVEALINDLSWEDLPQFRKAEKQYIKKEVQKDQITMATVKTYKQLSVATIYNAGHFAYNDKPEIVYQVVKEFIERINN